MWRTIAWATLGLGVIGGLTAVIGVLWAFHHFSRDLPDYRTLANYEPATTTRLHAATGDLLAEYATEQRLYVPIDAIPLKVKQAFLAAEDKNFYNHQGIDFFSVARAVYTNIRNYGTGRRLVGASTITQQVAKNFLLTNEVSFKRKIKEAILAHRIDRTFPKDRILELYLNEIYLGIGSYGVASAALNYFNKALEDLTIEEAAYLAALPKAPNNYHPTRKPFAARARRDWVIDRMLEEGFIGPTDAIDAKVKPIETRPRDKIRTARAAYFAEDVRRELIDLYGEETLYTGGLSVRTTVDPRLQAAAETALRDGLIAYDRRHGWRGAVAQLETLDDWAAQLGRIDPPRGAGDWTMAVTLATDDAGAAIGFADGRRARIPFAEMRWAKPTLEEQKTGPAPRSAADVLSVGDVVLVEAIGDGEADVEHAPAPAPVGGEAAAPQNFALRQIPDVQGAIVAIDPHTGRVVAMQGGYDFDKSVFNRATQALRQTGSAFKPFVYLAALDNGYTPATLILDAPFVLPAAPGRERWEPSNYSRRFNGPTPMRIGIEKSYNAMTVRLAQSIGMSRVVDYVRRFGITTKLEPVLAASLGAEEATLVQMTAGYAMLVNGGKRVTPTLIDRIQDRNGRTIYRHDGRQCRGCQGVFTAEDPMPAVPDDREQLIDERTAYQMSSMLEGVVKRGTGARIGVALPNAPLAGKTGTTNDFRDAWFVGFSPELAVGVYVGFDQPRTLGEKEAGSAVAAPVFQDFMALALDGQEVRPFRIPPDLRFVNIDRRTGRRASPGATGAIREAFKPGTEPKWSPAGFADDVLDPDFGLSAGYNFETLAPGAVRPTARDRRYGVGRPQGRPQTSGTMVIDSQGRTTTAPAVRGGLWPSLPRTHGRSPLSLPPALPRVSQPTGGSGGIY